MCGIAGALSARPIDHGRVQRMRDELAHRGPDHSGLWRSHDGRVVLGHRRLAIIDLTAGANQPLSSGDGRLVVTFNGEIYNHTSSTNRSTTTRTCPPSTCAARPVGR